MAKDATTGNDESMLTTVAKAVGTTAGIIVSKATELTAAATDAINKKTKTPPARKPAKAKAKKRVARKPAKSKRAKSKPAKRMTRKPAAKKRTPRA